jgi:hypothetical protein
MLHEALEQAATLSGVMLEMVLVDHGYKGGMLSTCRSGARDRGVLTRGLKAMIRRRAAPLNPPSGI